MRGIFLLAAFSALMWLACSARAQEVKHVVLVSIDGLAASYLDDPRAKLPTLRKLMAEGARAEGMITSFPSVTWPSHTSLVTGVHPARHGVIGNNAWDREHSRGVTYIGDPDLTKDQAIRVPTLYDLAHAAGLKCGSVIWPCSNGAKTLDWVIPDSNRQDIHDRYTTRGLADELAQAGIDISQLGTWGWNKQYSTERDIVYTRVANHLLKEHGVNLLLVHLITPDGVEHAFGPHTVEAYQAVAESDERIAEIWHTLQQPPLAGRSALFIVSDHGFAPYAKLIRPNVLLKELDLIATDSEGKVTGRQAWCVPQGGAAFIYILDQPRQAELTRRLQEKLAAVEGVAAVLQPDQFVKMGLPRPEANAEAPHLVLTTGPGYSFDGSLAAPLIADAGGLRGSHGHDPAPAYMHATFIAAGAGIKPGVRLKSISNTDVAPTIARLLGLEMKDADGRVLDEILAVDQ